MYGTFFRIGDISKTKFWLSVERKPFAYWRWHLSFGKTYVGTTAGICACCPWFTVLGHVRNLKYDYSKA